jgi:hypothetical protein
MVPDEDKRGNPMIRFVIPAFMTVVMVILIPAVSGAWEDPPAGTVVQMTATCAGNDVALSIDFSVAQAPPAQFVGWVVEREVVGLCTEDAWATEVLPWPPVGQTHLDLTITPDFDFFDVIYRIWAVDAEGNETFIYWPQRHNYAHVECRPGPTVVGEFVDYAGAVHFQACTGFCWPELSFFDGSYPPGAEDLVGTGQLMNLYGELFRGMEGDYIVSTSMEPSVLPCEPVTVSETSWGALKARYR